MDLNVNLKMEIIVNMVDYCTYGLYPRPEQIDTLTATTIDLTNLGTWLCKNLDLKCIFDVECNWIWL